MKKLIFNIYAFCIFALVPLLISPSAKDIFNNYKIDAAAFSTLIFIIIDIFILKSKYDFDNLDLSVAIYGVIITLSAFLSVNINYSVFGVPRSREGLISLITYIFIFIIFHKNYKLLSFKLIDFVFLSSAVISLYGILQIYHINPLLNGKNNEFRNMVTSTIGQRNFVGTYCTLLLPISIGIFIMKTYRRYAVYSILLFGLMLGSVTRSAWIAFAFYSLVLLYFSFKNKAVDIKKLILFLMICAVAFGIANITNKNMFTDRTKQLVHDAKNIDEDTAGSTRIYIWERTLPMILDKPILGSGPDTFGILYHKNGKPKYKILFDKAHNEYLQIALTEGLPALLLYLGMVLYILKGLYKRRNESFVNIILLCCISGYLMQAFFNISFISVAPIYWAMLGISAGRAYEISN
ncbi:O-antigen ligase family protein [Clostridium sp. 19966]|uniref:O-antigen ligase family protein n=1 Tax=Clostridium sp. 19966 TaxID=2768166 RepID=UPI0028DFD9BD|nr:O-antigen ligase family protein [Clostridium sp. 19966]MDT8716132.1 O-antigen ligase family protein [Clostridium sp. 19966]